MEPDVGQRGMSGKIDGETLKKTVKVCRVRQEESGGTVEVQIVIHLFEEFLEDNEDALLS